MSMETQRVEWKAFETSTAYPRCEKCDSHVTPQFARVFGDNDDTVHACPNCTTYRDIRSGSHLSD